VLGLGLGLIFGTTFSCVRAFQKVKGEISANEVGNWISFPSVVSFHHDQRFVGDSAIPQINLKPIANSEIQTTG
jgi:molecular chaperone DnaK (HSP70)